MLIRVLWADPERFDVTVQDGNVTLAGELEQRSHIPIAVRLSQRVDGVINVINHLGYAVDGTRRSARRL